MMFSCAVKYDSNLFILFVDDCVMWDVLSAVLSRVDFVFIQFSCKVVVQELVHALLVTLCEFVVCQQFALQKHGSLFRHFEVAHSLTW